MRNVDPLKRIEMLKAQGQLKPAGEWNLAEGAQKPKPVTAAARPTISAEDARYFGDRLKPYVQYHQTEKEGLAIDIVPRGPLGSDAFRIGGNPVPDGYRRFANDQMVEVTNALKEYLRETPRGAAADALEKAISTERRGRLEDVVPRLSPHDDEPYMVAMWNIPKDVKTFRLSQLSSDKWTQATANAKTVYKALESGGKVKINTGEQADGPTLNPNFEQIIFDEESRVLSLGFIVVPKGPNHYKAGEPVPDGGHAIGSWDSPFWKD